MPPDASSQEEDIFSRSPVNEEIMKELRLHLSEAEVKLVLSSSATSDEEDLMEFTR